jgi:hypothetical protein
MSVCEESFRSFLVILSCVKLDLFSFLWLRRSYNRTLSFPGFFMTGAVESTLIFCEIS